ncbi:MAG: lytic transglycosylase domain-containing protein [Deltaproteobacteria bacterium]|nr:lytic transglycosylase domain-containing protein [Deltaproteobacteria bacterium]
MYAAVPTRGTGFKLGASLALAGSLFLHGGDETGREPAVFEVREARDGWIDGDGADPSAGEDIETRLLKGTVGLVLAAKSDFDHDGRAELAAAIVDESRAAGIDPFLVMSVIKHESRFDPAAVSPKGAAGLMQLMPRTFAKLRCDLRADCSPDIFDPVANVSAGIRYLGRMRTRFKDPVLYVAAYRTGPERVKRYLNNELDEDEVGDLLGYPKLVMRDYACFKREYTKYTVPALEISRWVQ